MSGRHALVIGGSLAGLFTAALMRTIGWTVTVFERAAVDLAGRGAGLGARGELFDVMRRGGIPFDDTTTVTTRSRLAFDRRGETICEVPLREVSTAWDRIYRALRDALPKQSYRAGARLERFEQSADRVVATFANGTHAEGDLLIGADGLHSTVRRQAMPGLEPRYAGYVAWRALIEEADLPTSFIDLLFNHMIFNFPDGEMLMTVPVPEAKGSRAHRRRVQFSWFRPADADTVLPKLCTGSDGRHYGVSIPPPLIQREFVDALKNDAERLLAPANAAVVRSSRQPLLQPIFDFESPRLVFGRVVLVGDAAFVARPHVGTGVTKAALDAQELADAIAQSSDLDQALDRYDERRRAFGAALVARGRYLGGHAMARSEAREAPQIERFMNEFGAAGVIDGLRVTAPEFR